MQDLLCVTDHLGDARIVVALDHHQAGVLGGDQGVHPLQHLVDVAGPIFRQLIGSEHAVDEVPQAVRLVDDDIGVIAEIGIFEFSGQQLRRTADAAQRVLDHAVEGLQFDEQPVHLAVVQRRDVVVHRDLFLGLHRLERGDPLGERLAGRQGLIHLRDEILAVAEQGRDVIPPAAFTAGGEQGFRRLVHEQHAQ